MVFRSTDFERGNKVRITCDVLRLNETGIVVGFDEDDSLYKVWFEDGEIRSFDNWDLELVDDKQPAPVASEPVSKLALSYTEDGVEFDDAATDATHKPFTDDDMKMWTVRLATNYIGYMVQDDECCPGAVKHIMADIESLVNEVKRLRWYEVAAKKLAQGYLEWDLLTDMDWELNTPSQLLYWEIHGYYDVIMQERKSTD